MPTSIARTKFRGREAATSGASLQVGVAAKHALMCVRNALSDLEDDGVEKNEAALFEQATAELLRLLDRHEEHRISKRGECAFRPGVNKITSAPSALAILAKLTLTGVSPDPRQSRAHRICGSTGR